uniref:MADS-box protein 55 n=1 Tax=Cunninghamia lanceolata TaxID=28977 RepID=A0A8F3BYA1_CUNLA|nr:MADS-box protein 55 [Cunninghamia lanceolata]
MGRAKIPIKWISKDASRNLTFLKRKKGLKKKVEELSVLCGIDACMVCFGNKTDQQTCQEQHLDVWPSMSKALEVIERYRRLSKDEQNKKKLDNSSFLQQRINKLKFELNMKRKEKINLEMGTMYPCWDNSLNYLSVEKLRDLMEYIDVKLEAVGDRINLLTRQEHEIYQNVAAENNIVPFREMEYIGRQSLTEPYHSPTSQIMLHNLKMPIPYQNQEGVSLTMGHVQPYLNKEGRFSENPFATTAINYSSKANPIILTAMEDYQYAANPLAFGNNNNGIDKDKVEIVVMDNLQHDRFFVEDAHLVASKSFPLISEHHVHPNACFLGSYSGQWTPCCTVYSPCPQQYNMGSNGSQTATIPEFKISCEPQQLQPLNGLINVQNAHEEMVKYEVINSADSPIVASSRLDEEHNIESKQCSLHFHNMLAISLDQ